MADRYDVVAICNALVDLIIKVEEDDIRQLELNKGIMHLVEADRQKHVLNHFSDHDQHLELGGSALNALRSIAGMGGQTAFAGMIGKDAFGERIKDRMTELGITACVGELDEHTGSCAVLVTPDGERTMNTCLGASRLFDESLVPQIHIETAKVFHFCGYQWDTDGQKAAIYHAIDTAKKANTLISFDVADPFVVQRYHDEFVQLIAEKADIAFANQAEAEMLYKCGPDEAAQKIAETGAIAVVKKGAQGAVICKDGKLIQVPAVATNVVDTTAAGDCFAGGFLYAFTQGKSLETCGKTAAHLAADVISRIGTTVSKSVLDQAKAF